MRRLVLPLALLLACCGALPTAPRVVRVPQCVTVLDTVQNRLPNGPPFVLLSHEVCS